MAKAGAKATLGAEWAEKATWMKHGPLNEGA